MTKTTTPMPILDLQAGLTGRAILPGDAEYDTARMIFMGGVDKHPAAIRSGGHSGAAHSTSEGGIVLDLSEMKSIDFDLANRTAWVEAGITAAAFTEKAAEHGLAVGFGDTGSVGLGGLILGAGVGYLS